MWRAVFAASLLAGCATVERVEQRFGNDRRAPPPDTALAAVMAATAPRACPNGRTLEGANHEAFGPQHDVTVTDIATTPVAGDPSHAVRLRRIVIAPGGVIAWHVHDRAQGMALIVSGQATEIRNSCMDPIVYLAGDVALEDATTAHGWRNDGDTPTVVLVSHVIVREP
jgi:quercetin dioxygenase-like cupin family protein